MTQTNNNSALSEAELAKAEADSAMVRMAVAETLDFLAKNKNVHPAAVTMGMAEALAAVCGSTASGQMSVALELLATAIDQAKDTLESYKRIGMLA